MNRKFYVQNRAGIIQHEGTLDSCKAYIKNAGALFGVRGLTVVVRDGRKFVPYDEV